MDVGTQGRCTRDAGWDGIQAGRAGGPDPPRGSLLPAGLQTVLPPHLRERFVAAALSYIACGSAGELLCRRSDCRCQCQPAFPHCNCPEADVQALEGSLAQLQRAWESHHGQFEESGEGGGKLPGCWDPDPRAAPCPEPSGRPQSCSSGGWQTHLGSPRGCSGWAGGATGAPEGPCLACRVGLAVKNEEPVGIFSWEVTTSGATKDRSGHTSPPRGSPECCRAVRAALRGGPPLSQQPSELGEGGTWKEKTFPHTLLRPIPTSI